MGPDPAAARAGRAQTAASSGCFVDLYWLPVGAGAPSRMRDWSLAVWEGASAFLGRRRRGALYHAALKMRLDSGTPYTVELTPVFIGEPAAPAMTGPVGFRSADRLRIFRYQLRCLEAEALPDEEWVVGSPIRLSTDCQAGPRLLSLAPTVPPHSWGRRVRGTSEMWTSASVISWLLMRAGIDARAIPVPAGGRAPGWQAGLELAALQGWADAAGGAEAEV